MEKNLLVRSKSFFTIIYFVEGIITSMFSLSYLYLTGIGIDPGSLSIITFIALAPLFFKPFAGIISDKFPFRKFGRRKPWLIIGICVQAISFFVLSAINPLQNLNFYMIAMTFAVASLVVYDTCADGFALDILSPEEYAGTQFWMTTGRYLAILIIPPIVTQLAHSINWQFAFITLGLFSAIPLIFIFKISEPETTVLQKFSLGSIRKILLVPGIFICLLGFIAMVSTSGTEEIWLAYIRDDVNVPLNIVGWFGTIYGVGIIIGAIIGAKLYKSMGKVKSNIITFSLIILSAIMLLIVSGSTMAVVAAVVFGLTMGILHVTVFSFGMTLRIVGAEATTFGIFSVFLVTGTVIAMTISPWLVSHIQYSGIFLINAVVASLGLILLAMINWREKVNDQNK